MSTTYTANTKLSKPGDGDTGWTTPIRADLDALDAVAAIGGCAVSLHEVPSTTLNVAVAAGTYRAANGTYATFAGSASFAMTTAIVNYVWLDATGTLTKGAAWPTGVAYYPLAVVTAGASTITSIVDARRALTPNFVQATGGSATAGGTYTATEQGMLQAVYNQMRALGFLT